MTPVLRIEMRDACGEEMAISGLEELIEIAIPLRRSACTLPPSSLQAPSPS